MHADPALWARLLVAALFVFANAFFVLSEFAMVRVRSTRIDELAAHGSRRARMAQRIQRHIDAYLSANQLGITVASIGLGWVGEPAVATILEPVFGWLNFEATPSTLHGTASAIAFGLVTFAHTVLGELVPKSLAILRSERWALRTAHPLHWFYVGAWPVIAAFNAAANAVVRLMGYDPRKVSEDSHTIEELRAIVWGLRVDQTGLDEELKRLVSNVLDYRNRDVREVMTPRNRVVSVDADMRLSEAFDEVVLANRWTRYPVWEPEPDGCRGYIHLRDVAVALRDRPGALVRDVVRPAPLVTESTRVEAVRRMMVQRREHLALVVDEFGDFVGIVTMEDILEEVFGPIQDEWDSGEVPEVSAVQPGREWVVDGNLLIERAERLLGVSLQPHPSGQDTVAGYVLARLGRMAREGDEVIGDGFLIRVEKLDGMRIARVRLVRAAPSA